MLISGKENEFLLVHQNELINNNEFVKIISRIDKSHSPIGFERLLYPYFFISSDRKRYIKVAFDHSSKLIIPFMGIDRHMYEELLFYSKKIGYQLLIVDFYYEWLDTDQLNLIPLGVWQNINIDKFTLKGNKMRKLRYMVQKFEQLGDSRIEEYNPGSDLPLIEMRDLMIKWSQGKNNIIKHSFTCMEELLRQKLSDGYRAFLTYNNNKLCSIIVIGNENNMYIMDQEFYDPESAPLGHMEYAMVQIIEILRKENARTFSVGLTWYPFIFENDERKDNEGWEWLKKQNEKKTLLSKIFEQGKKNYQFKKKFGEVGMPIFAYLPNKMSFSQLFNYWPIFYTNSLTANKLEEEILKVPLLGFNEGNLPEKKYRVQQVNNTMVNRDQTELLINKRNLDRIDVNKKNLDLRTDSWFNNNSDFIKKHEILLKSKTGLNTLDVIQDIFPFKHIILTERGRVAEQLFYKAYSKKKRKILTTIPWLTTLMNQLQNGFEVTELPSHSVKDPMSTCIFKGEMDLNILREQLLKNSEDIASVNLEVLNNATGGHPVRLTHLKLLKSMLEEYQVPLVMDASRIVRNAYLINKYEEPFKQMKIWDIVRSTTEQADYIVTSLTKDFAVPIGGLIATNDDQLARDIKEIQLSEGFTLTDDIKYLIIQGFFEKEVICELISSQMEFTKNLQDMLLQYQVPLLQPACGHSIVIDISGYTGGKNNTQKKRNFLEKLFLETGIKGGAHHSGKQKQTVLNNCIRLAFPIGLTEIDKQEIYKNLKLFFSMNKCL
ncbi:beta-eliminating lyase-related protein [Bacillus cereus group sp. BfR-BA-01441]|uniref:beta-eliminating lyase-related protein n=1 Tax=Bacillus cereus group sp. BfR-BA-01441 TaxID=2920348 RepID=UPI001F5995BE